MPDKDARSPRITAGDMDAFFLENVHRPPSEPMIDDEIMYSGTRAGFAAAVYRNDGRGRWMKSVMGHVVERFESLNVSAYGAVVFKGGHTVSFVRPGVRTSGDSYLDPLVIDAREAGLRAMMLAIEARTPPTPDEPACFVCEKTFAIWRGMAYSTNFSCHYFNWAARGTAMAIKPLLAPFLTEAAAPDTGGL